ncbi:MAG: hypothetical protein IT460_04085 [Planctomycetes bacterium]|nr:hypothetical protein [Planctomycetota bacterium]
MASSFTWLDYSESERRAMLDVIDLFKEQDTRDELGLAPIRDALSDRFFPGTIVPQTRARYYLFVPWIYRRLEEKRVAASEIARKARVAEGDLIEVLKRLDETGVIGRQSGVNIRRLPSNTYWPGLVRWGIFLGDMMQDQYHTQLDALYERRRVRPTNDDKEVVGGTGGLLTWDPEIPTAPTGFPESVDFRLPRKEARYLQGRIEMSVPQSLLAWFVGHGRSADRLDELGYAWDFGRTQELRPDLHSDLDQARCFSEAMEGAALLYNLLLCREAGRDDGADKYVQASLEWIDRLRSRRAALAAWNPAGFWPLVEGQGHRIPARARLFVERWVAWLAASGWNPASLDAPTPSTLVRDREIEMKGTQSRFQNARLREIWGGEAGVGAMGFRWRIARGILADILDGLEGAD